MKIHPRHFVVADAKIFLAGQDEFDKRFFVCENKETGMAFFKNKKAN